MVVATSAAIATSAASTVAASTARCHAAMRLRPCILFILHLSSLGALSFSHLIPFILDFDCHGAHNFFNHHLFSHPFFSHSRMLTHACREANSGKQEDGSRGTSHAGTKKF